MQSNTRCAGGPPGGNPDGPADRLDRAARRGGAGGGDGTHRARGERRGPRRRPGKPRRLPCGGTVQHGCYGGASTTSRNCLVHTCAFLPPSQPGATRVKRLLVLDMCIASCRLASMDALMRTHGLTRSMGGAGCGEGGAGCCDCRIGRLGERPGGRVRFPVSGRNAACMHCIHCSVHGTVKPCITWKLLRAAQVVAW